MNTATATEQQTDELSSLLAKIRGTSQAETDYAECLSRALYNRGIDDLDMDRAHKVWHSVRVKRQEQEWQANPIDGYCMTCGKTSSLRQCMRCRDGQEDSYRPRFHSIV